MIEDNNWCLSIFCQNTGMEYRYRFISENSDYGFIASQYCKKIAEELLFWAEVTLYNNRANAKQADYIRLHDMFYMIPWYVKKKYPELTKVALSTRPFLFDEENKPKVITSEAEDEFFETFCK